MHRAIFPLHENPVPPTTLQVIVGGRGAVIGRPIHRDRLYVQMVHGVLRFISERDSGFSPTGNVDLKPGLLYAAPAIPKYVKRGAQL